MPPRYSYWTIIVGGQPTAFRAATRDELLPTLKQMQARQPDAAMKWFARGKLWESPEEATEALRAERRGEGKERRGPGWRPGGVHEDPRDRFKVPRDVKRKRFAERMRREDRGEGGEQPGGGGQRPFRPREDRPWKPAGERPFKPGGQRPFKPGGERPFRPREDRPFKPAGERPFKPDRKSVV